MRPLIRTVYLFTLLGVAGPVSAQAPTNDSNGRFIGRVMVEWIEEPGPDRSMRLLQPFTYEDGRGKKWMVPANTVVDGASIPQAFWSTIGSPFTGDYRRASVVHDRYCVTKSEPWKAVHRMFFEAMLAAGVEQPRALGMYAAVYGGGPRWERVKMGGLEGNAERLVEITPRFSEQEYRDIVTWIATDQPSVEEVERRIDAVTND